MSPRKIPTASTTPSTRSHPEVPSSSPLTPVVLDQAEPLTPTKKAPKDHRRDYKLHRTTRARTITATGLALSPTRKQLQTRTVHSQVRFLREYAQCGIILRAAQAAGVGRRIVSHWREDPAFEALMVEVHEDALDLLEEEARRRGADGVVEPVYQGGKEVGSIRRYSDHLLMMFLKGKRRESFSERTETTGPNGSPLAPAVVLVSWHHSMKPPEQP